MWQGKQHVLCGFRAALGTTYVSSVLVLGAEADAAHAATMAVLAGVSANWRRFALADALASDPAAGRLLAPRDRWARRLASRLAPGARLRPGRV